jgi:Zn-dependent peptidase ImmA (M78 family)
VRLRDDTSSQGIDEAEKEANLFAAELLMPEEFLKKDLAGRSTLDLYDEDYIPQLAENYGVSVQALMFRLQYLGYIEN